MGPFKCVIIEDDDSERISTEKLISAYSYLKIVGTFSDPVECLDILRSGEISILFSNINMRVTGANYLKMLKNPPLYIFFTSYPESAIKAFDEQAVDCILRPLKAERLEKAIRRTLELLEMKSKALLCDIRLKKEYLMIKEGSVTSRVDLTDIIYLEALTNYTRIITQEKNYLTLQNLKNFLETHPSGRFLRIHRSYAVAIDKISGINTNEVLLDKQRLPLGKTFRHNIRKLISHG
ncbi:MAG TPA: LytTR family DNA-binding domain-containing protein [Chitinophagaceae bacterium]|nr:LytTR family DNA-binding domain-containing protein [Chitinophagaceae bacterium]